MIAASLKSVWARKLRLIMSTFAIVLGVAFVAGSLMFTDTLDRAFSGIMNGTVGDAVVRPVTAQPGAAAQNRVIPASVLVKARRLPVAAQVDGVVTSTSATVLDRRGKVIGGQGAPAFGVNYHDARAADGAQGLHVTSGRAPTRSGEVALDAKTAERGGYHLGDRVTVLTSGATPRYTGTLVGTAQYADGAMVGSTLAVVDTRTAQQLFLDGRDVYTSLWAQAAPGVSQAKLANALKPLAPAGFEASTGRHVSDEEAGAIKKALRFITTFLLVFAGIALLVGSFLIVNTFGILVAQRSRELALLRALGASRGQVLRAVMLEALAVGIVGSALGVGLGVLLARLIAAVVARLGADLDSDLVFAPRTVVVSFVVGIGVTALAAWVPARRASRVAPITAMRDDPVEPEGRLTTRALVGAVLFVVGAGFVGVNLRTDGPIVVFVIGLVLMLAGTISAMPVLATPVVRGLGALARRPLGIVAQLAEENALRNPRRTSATAAALMIGLALVSMMTVFGASAAGSVDALIHKNFRGDYVVRGQFGEPMSPSVAAGVRKVDGVASLTRLRYGQGSVDGHAGTVEGVDAASYRDVAPVTMTQGSGSLNDDGVLMSRTTAQKHGMHVGDTVHLTLGAAKPRSVRVLGLFDPKDSGTLEYVVTLPTFSAAGGTEKDTTLYVERAPGASAAQVEKGLDAVVAPIPTITVKDQAGYAAEQRKPIDRMLMLIYALLGLAIVIAVLGIVNTLALSVIERTREIGLLRAVGLSRAQLRSMVRLEAITISLVGAVIGVVLGTIFGVLFQRSQADSGVDVLVVPSGRLVLFLALAAVVGVLAAWWPARRAARLDILRAIATE